MKLSHFFIPHPETHKKAHFLSIKALAIYVLMFLFLHAGLTSLSIIKPDVLGINSKVDKEELIRLVNVEREKKGLYNLKENEKLEQAAMEKGKNMFDEDYWAHYSPSGKDPWSFISGSGYKFSYAGENLARNFYTSPEVVQAWMDSPTHRDNLLNTHYQDVGIAVLEGTLKGQQTVLIVQEFGTPVDYVAINDRQTLEKAVSIAESSLNKQANSTLGESQEIVKKPFIDRFALTKTIGLVAIGFVALLLILDFIIIKKRGVFRIASSRHLPHFAVLGTAAGLLMSMSPGSIL